MAGSEHSESSSIFPRPRSYPRTIFMGKFSPSLQAQMGLQNREDTLRHITGVIRQTCRKHGVDLYVRYNEQDRTQLLKVRDEVVNEIPELQRYEQGWPVLFYLKITMCDHGTHNPRRYNKRKNMTRDENHPLPSRSLVQKRQKTESKPSSDATAGPVRDTVRKAYLNKPVETTLPRRTEDISFRDARSGGTATDDDVIIISDSEDPGPTTSTSAVASATPSRCSSQATLFDSPRSTFSHDANKTSRSVFDVLVSGGIPRADAEQLARLLASCGITTKEYLGVLARMKSLNVWLLELWGQNKISEIQMRIMRDILEDLASC